MRTTVESNIAFHHKNSSSASCGTDRFCVACNFTGDESAMPKREGRETEVSRPAGETSKERQPLTPSAVRMTEALLAFRQNCVQAAPGSRIER